LFSVKKCKENTTADLSINQCTVIWAYFCCYAH